MKEPKSNQREQDILSVLEYCSNKQKKGKSPVFSVFERILINQERGSLLSQSNQETPLQEKRHYKVSQKIEKKIAFTLNEIEIQNSTL